MGTETWLNPSIASSEFFPPNYEVLRQDRSDSYGGVLLAIKKDYIADSLTLPAELSCEAVFAKLTIGRCQSLIVGSVYRPPGNDSVYNQSLCNAVQWITSMNKGAAIWIGGDFNLPDINWNTSSICGHQNSQQINNEFLDMVHSCAFEQCVNFPTRNENTLDLFLSNRPGLVNRCSPVPGIGDHDIVFVDSLVSAKRAKQQQRKIFLWKNASKTNLRKCQQHLPMNLPTLFVQHQTLKQCGMKLRLT
ncbi:hypothetical protein FSP39_023193 [Pinctada imbricata]|uniref:Endonuclease/exonuclease/phosphatase domain-containing protein n=1 Tax=Pinctada imbricata TaxID=66713 RepID=A0AA89BY39_PINIB|nr:hypothetical protein FSP39_023193 [Pinctada imbricata]